jgi:hypothetical protein
MIKINFKDIAKKTGLFLLMIPVNTVIVSIRVTGIFIIWFLMLVLKLDIRTNKLINWIFTGDPYYTEEK